MEEDLMRLSARRASRDGPGMEEGLCLLRRLVIGEPLRKFVKQGGQRCPVGFLMRELLHSLFEPGRQGCLVLREFICDGGCAMLQLVSQIAVRLLALLPELPGRLLEDSGEGVQLRRQRADGARAALLFGAQTSRHLLDFRANVLFQCGEAFLEVLPQLSRLCKQLRFELGKPALVVADLGAE